MGYFKYVTETHNKEKSVKFKSSQRGRDIEQKKKDTVTEKLLGSTPQISYNV